jgi:hypothetical protein
VPLAPGLRAPPRSWTLLAPWAPCGFGIDLKPGRFT